MRISDWSSDVCSSDLIDHADVARPHPAVDEDLCILFRPPPITLHHLRTAKGDFPRLARRGAFRRVLAVHQHDAGAGQRLTDGEAGSASCRKACASRCRSWWSPVSSKTHTNT